MADGSGSVTHTSNVLHPQQNLNPTGNQIEVTVNPVTQVGVNTIEGDLNVQVQELPPLQEIHHVQPEPLQQSVQETKTKERRLVFDTLKEVNRNTLDSYENINIVKSRFENEIIRANPDLPQDQMNQFLNGLHGSPKNLDKSAIKQRLENLGFTEKEADKIVRRACFVGTGPISSNMKDFKAKLAQKIIREKEGINRAPLSKTEKKQIEKDVKKLDLGGKTRELSTDDLKEKLIDARLLSRISAATLSKKMCEATRIDQVGLLKSDLTNTDTFKTKLFHAVVKQGINDGYPPPTQAEAKALKAEIDKINLPSNPKKISEKKLAKELSERGIVPKKFAGDVAKGVCKEYQASLKDADGEARKLAAVAQELNRLLGTEPKDGDLKKVNEKVITLLRDAFETKAYQSLKECEDNPTIHYLHEVNLAMYTKVSLLDAYVSSGDEGPSLGDKLVQGHENKTLGEQIQEVRSDAVENRGLFASHSCMKYILNHFEQFWGAFTSQKVGSPFGTYDPHGSLGNNAGALYEETLDVGGKPGKALDVRTPSPTVNDKVSREFKAGLQAIENQRIAESMGDPGFGRPNCWVYTNYQDMTDLMNGEHGRSKAIMNLNDEFPLSFKGITLSKDSNYFKEGLGHGEGDKLWESIDHDLEFNKDSIPKFVDDLKEMLINDAHFTLSNRTKDKGEKLYFPAKNKAEIIEYKAELEMIADLTGKFLEDVMKENEFEGKDAWMIKAAAKEFAWAAIQKYVQAKELQKLSDQGINPSIISTSACKEDIDRGFSDHIKRMYMLGAGDTEFLAKIVNMPALMARYRVILNDRIQPLVGVVTHVDRDVAKTHLNKVTESLGVSSTSAEILHQSVQV